MRSLNVVEPVLPYSSRSRGDKARTRRDHVKYLALDPERSRCCTGTSGDQARGASSAGGPSRWRREDITQPGTVWHMKYSGAPRTKMPPQTRKLFNPGSSNNGQDDSRAERERERERAMQGSPVNTSVTRCNGETAARFHWARAGLEMEHLLATVAG